MGINYISRSNNSEESWEWDHGGTKAILRSPLPGEALLFFALLESDSDSGCLGLRLSAVMNVGRWGGGGVELSGWGD